MFIASQKRKENIAEYLLYMWQIEDLIRANDLSIDNIRKNILDHYPNISDEQYKQLFDWYESLIDMMRRENVETCGHLQINRNVISNLVTLHQTLLQSTKFPEYAAEFYRTLPYIVELRAKSGNNKVGEIETCFNALYGMLLMRLKHKEISPETATAMAQISRFIALLVHKFNLDEADRLFCDE